MLLKLSYFITFLKKIFTLLSECFSPKIDDTSVHFIQRKIKFIFYLGALNHYITYKVASFPVNKVILFQCIFTNKQWLFDCI